MTKQFRLLAREVGLPPARLHDLQHYRAASLISVGERLEVVSKLLGHSSVAVISSVYSHLFEQQGRAAGDRAAALVSVPNTAPLPHG